MNGKKIIFCHVNEMEIQFDNMKIDIILYEILTETFIFLLNYCTYNSSSGNVYR